MSIYRWQREGDSNYILLIFKLFFFYYIGAILLTQLKCSSKHFLHEFNNISPFVQTPMSKWHKCAQMQVQQVSERDVYHLIMNWAYYFSLLSWLNRTQKKGNFSFFPCYMWKLFCYMLDSCIRAHLCWFGFVISMKDAKTKKS